MASLICASNSHVLDQARFVSMAIGRGVHVTIGRRHGPWITRMHH
jgi:hypothetical protein